jgi:TonB family protein
MTHSIPKWSRIVGKTLLVIALEFFLFGAVASTLDAQLGSGITARGKVVVFGRDRIGPIADAIKYPRPQYPYAERSGRHQGSGVFRMIIDPKTGLVTRVIVEKSTGFKGLDDAAVEAYSQWRWKPGTWKEISIPTTWGIAASR